MSRPNCDEDDHPTPSRAAVALSLARRLTNDSDATPIISNFSKQPAASLIPPVLELGPAATTTRTLSDCEEEEVTKEGGAKMEPIIKKKKKYEKQRVMTEPMRPLHKHLGTDTVRTVWNSVATTTSETRRFDPSSATQKVPRLEHDNEDQDKDRELYDLLSDNDPSSSSFPLNRVLALRKRDDVLFDVCRLGLTGLLLSARRVTQDVCLLPELRHDKMHRQRYYDTGDGPRRICGLRNYGQACFLNSVLQSLAASEPFLAYLERVVELYREQIDFEDAPETGDDKEVCSLSETLWNVLRQVNGANRNNNKAIDPRGVLVAVGKEHAQFRGRYAGHNGVGREQQDAQELLQALIGSLVSEAHLDSASSVSSRSFGQNAGPLLMEDDNDTVTVMSCLQQKRRSQHEIGGNGLSALDVSHLTLEATRSDPVFSNGRAGVFRGTECTRDIEKFSGDEEPDRPSWQEEKKEFELHVPRVDSEEDLHFPLPVQAVKSNGECLETLSDVSKEDTISSTASKDSTLSTAMQIMMSTVSSVTPSPLAGWCGSTLQCADCKHVRPISNTPFLDIPIIPTAVSNQFSLRSNPPQKHASRTPPCSLEKCLEDFTRVERVQDVECRNCTLRSEIARWEDEVKINQEAVDWLLTKAKRQGSDKDAESSRTSALQDVLRHGKQRLLALKQTDPDDDGPLDHLLLDDDDEQVVMGEQPTSRKIKRGDAFKRLYLTRLPAVLCLHVQRRYYDPVSNKMTKTTQHVIFPEYLDVGPFCAYSEVGSSEGEWAGTKPRRHPSGPKAPIHYRLISVIEHRGTAFGGHYVCFRRHPATGQWMFVSDEVSKPAKWQDVQQCQAYMLFYEAL